jgi:ABC-type sugar transport system substrate-binding protein
VTGRFAARAALAVAVLLAIGLAACGGKDSRSADKSNNSGDSSSALTGGNDIDGKKVLFLEPNNAGNVFDKPVMKAVDAAEALTGLDVNFQFADTNMAKLRDMVKTGIAQNVGGIIVSIPDGSLNEAICDAREAGIPVIAWNVNGTTGRGRDCVMAFIGQSFVTSGEVIGNRMIEEGVIKQGDEVFCPVEFPESSYAAERAAGVNNALEKMGTKCSVVGTTADLSRARTTMVQYLLGHRNTKAIISLGGTPNSVAEAAVKQARIGEVALGGFDLTPEIIESVQNGSMIATVDQQPYSQGFFSVMQMALLLKYGLYPSDMATGGRGLVDKSNVDLVASLVPDYR